MKYLIYTIKSPSNKIYLGVTNNFVRRMAEHKYYWLKNPQSIALHNSFSKYGFESHFKEIMIDNLDRKTAYSLEEKLINDMNLLDSKIGLNSRKGGSGGNIIDWNKAGWKQYWKRCDWLTRKIRKQMLENWNGYDYISGDYIKDNLNLHYSHGDYPTLDHIKPRSQCFKEGLSPYEATKPENLAWTTRKNNSKKSQKKLE